MTPNALIIRVAASALIGLLVGCAAPQPLYSWNSYQPEVYKYLKNEASSSEEQILALEKGIEQTAAKNAVLPPGYRAHLGMLYLNVGRTDQALAAWEKEKMSFPESTQYIDYLINNMKKNKG